MPEEQEAEEPHAAPAQSEGLPGAIVTEIAIELAAESAEIARMWLTIQQDRRAYIRRLLEDEVTAATEVKKSTSGDGGMQQNIADPLDGFKTPAAPRQTKREQKKESR